MSSPKVIVFGPTGAVGSAAAITASELGAHVVLAMRDTSKSIPGLSAAQEKQGKFSRVSADLGKPETVLEAIKSTGAKHAFFYLNFKSPDSMKSTIEAMKTGGIVLPVFLSSFSVLGDLKAIQPSEIIPFMHAQVELNLDEIFGDKAYVALRPGSFASNSADYKATIEKGDVKVIGPDAMVDCIVPEDIGRVGGTVLAKGLPEDGERKLYLLGPELLTVKETVKILAKVLGKDPKIEAADKETATKMIVEGRGLPAAFAEYMIRQSEAVNPGHDEVFGYSINRAQMGNVEKYSGKKSTGFEEWAERNKGKFVS